MTQRVDKPGQTRPPPLPTTGQTRSALDSVGPLTRLFCPYPLDYTVLISSTTRQISTNRQAAFASEHVALCPSGSNRPFCTPFSTIRLHRSPRIPSLQNDSSILHLPELNAPTQCTSRPTVLASPSQRVSCRSRSIPIKATGSRRLTTTRHDGSFLADLSRVTRECGISVDIWPFSVGITRKLR
jgi:hypothetical protein